MTTTRSCKDCIKEGVTTNRDAKYPGPRCYTHHYAEKKRRSRAAHGRKTQNNFGITEEQYWALYEHQHGRCFICRRARGIARRLAVDHDHACTRGHVPAVGCPFCIRALLCSTCNRTIGRWDVAALNRAITVLTDPPAQKFLKGR